MKKANRLPYFTLTALCCAIAPIHTLANESTASPTSNTQPQNIQSKKNKHTFKFLSQFRYSYRNSTDNLPAAGGFESRRARMFVAGDTHLDKLNYKLMFDFNHQIGTAALFDAFMTYPLDPHWTLTIGQFRLPFNREQLVGVGAQLGMDRSQLNYGFNLGKKGGRSQGVMLNFSQDAHLFSVAFSEGTSGANTALQQDQTFAGTARYEHLFLGKWRQFKRYSSTQSTQSGLLAGFAFHVQDGEVLQTTGDLSFQSSGATANLYFYTKKDGEYDQNGFGLQVGQFITDKTESFLQVSLGDSGLGTQEDNFQSLTLGLNHYIKTNKIRLTSEIHHSFKATGALFSKGNQGYTTSADENQSIIRTQLQLIF